MKNFHNGLFRHLSDRERIGMEARLEAFERTITTAVWALFNTVHEFGDFLWDLLDGTCPPEEMPGPKM